MQKTGVHRTSSHHNRSTNSCTHAKRLVVAVAAAFVVEPLDVGMMDLQLHWHDSSALAQQQHKVRKAEMRQVQPGELVF